MTYQRVIHKKVVSPDGKAIAEATSTVIVSGDRQGNTVQSVSTTVNNNSSSSSSSSSSSASYSSLK